MLVIPSPFARPSAPCCTFEAPGFVNAVKFGSCARTERRGGGLRRRRVVRRQSVSPLDRSYDSEDDLDPSFSEELLRHADPKRAERFSRRLELMWRVSQMRKPAACECCQQTGEAECPFCHGTGVMTLGDVVYCSMAGCEKCVVCNGTGLVKCKNCNGTGFRAGWMEPGHPAV